MTGFSPAVPEHTDIIPGYSEERPDRVTKIAFLRNRLCLPPKVLPALGRKSLNLGILLLFMVSDLCKGVNLPSLTPEFLSPGLLKTTV